MREPRVTERQRRTVTRRAQNCCEYCGSQADFSQDPFSVEHIIPRSRGGGNDLRNLALSCLGCNGIKSTSTTAVDPITGSEEPLFHPRRQRWTDHFAWTGEFTRVVGLTAVGRATVEKLLLNRPGLVNQRRVLRAQGEHPPRGFQNDEPL